METGESKSENQTTSKEIKVRRKISPALRGVALAVLGTATLAASIGTGIYWCERDNNRVRDEVEKNPFFQQKDSETFYPIEKDTQKNSLEGKKIEITDVKEEGRAIEERVYTEKFKSEAKKIVLDYIKNIDEGKYKTAYSMLSEESKKLHSFAEFEKDCGSGAEYEAETAKVEVTEQGLEVIVQTYQDIAEHGFCIAEENNKPKIIYNTGIPLWPYK